MSKHLDKKKQETYEPLSLTDAYRKLDDAIMSYKALRPALLDDVMRLCSQPGGPWKINFTAVKQDNFVPVPKTIARGRVITIGADRTKCGIIAEIQHPNRFVVEYDFTISGTEANSNSDGTEAKIISERIAGCLHDTLKYVYLIFQLVQLIEKRVDAKKIHRLRWMRNNMPLFPYLPDGGADKENFNKAIDREIPLLDGARAELDVLMNTKPAADGKRKHTKRRNRNVSDKQLAAIIKVNECDGNFAEAARQLNITPKAVRDRYDAGIRNGAGKLRGMLPKTKTRGLSHGRRGEVLASTNDERF